MNEIYLDNSATTFLDPRVAEAMQAFQRSQPGNASSLHSAGLRAAVGVEKARNIIAGAVGASPDEVIFCSGGTEANNTAIYCSVRDLGVKHIISSPIEHHAVTHTVEKLEQEGADWVAEMISDQFEAFVPSMFCDMVCLLRLGAGLGQRRWQSPGIGGAFSNSRKQQQLVCSQRHVE